MGRLTKRIIKKFPNHTTEAIELNSEWGKMDIHADEEFYDIAEKLAHYEDLEEQGRLIELPCAVGDTVWFYQKAFDEICEARIIKFEFNCFTEPQLWIEVEYVSRLVGEQTHKGRVDLMLGKIVFHTKEEAEAKLKELEGDKE